MQQVVGMCSSFEANKSTKGASKLRRDLINGEIANLRDLLPLPSSTRQRLSQLQLMALVCVYVRKSNYFQQIFKRYPEMGHLYGLPNIGFSKALSGFLIMMTQNGKLLYISDNAAEYLGHSMEDLLIHGDSAYDIIDKADHGTVQAELLRSSNVHNPPGNDARLFLCRMNVSRNARRQMRFGDQKVVLVEGHFLPFQLPLCSRNEPVFVAMCTPVAMPETRECVVQGATNVFTSIHAIDMKFMHIDRNGEHYLGYTRSELAGISWYQLIHWNYMREAQSKHRLICQSEQEKSCILLLRLEAKNGEWIWVHCVLQVKDGTDAPQSQQSVIVATNQVLSEREAAVMRANSWIYHYYTVQTKLQYGLAYPDTQGAGGGGTPGSPSSTAAAAAAAAARLAAAAAYFPATKIMNHNGQASPYNFYPTTAGHPAISPESSAGYSPMPLHSPHPNGVYNSAFHHSFDLRNGKESPLDFSLAAATATGSPYEFPGGYPSPGYWPHPRYHPHGYTSSRAEEGGVLSTISASTASPYGWSSLPGASLSASTNGTTQHHNHHHHHHQQPIHHQASLNGSSSNNNNNITVTNTSPSSLSSHIVSNAKRPKRIKKNIEIIASESDLPSGPTARPASVDVSHMLDNEVRFRNYGGGGGGTEIMTMTNTTPFTHLIRPRKLLSSTSTVDEEDHEVVRVEEESMTMACPLTPSPIWEGQTHRVPDLQLYSTERDQAESIAAANNNNNPDLTHRVPTMELLWSHVPPPPGHFSR